MRLFLALLLAAPLGFAEHIPIVVAPQAGEVERTAATELASHLAKIYPADRFEPANAVPRKGKAILLGAAARMLGVKTPSGPESFVVGSKGERGYVVAGDARGVLHGVYALLERLGWGFYLSYDAAPSPRKEPFGFAGWNLADKPVFRDRVIFQWHNFLSSASTWEYEDWQRWIDGASRMRYNTVMIHAYGNNPMFSFHHNGQTKPVGYLATTRKGRDWGTQHVNDVRRMVGGGIFGSAEFGGSAATVPEEKRVEAAQAMTGKALAYAHSHGLHVTFALDVDTESANPQNIILTLPEAARFHSGKLWLPNPDTPEGYEYFKAQARQLLALYPQIDRLAIWFRAGGTPWRNVKPEEFPSLWQQRFAAALEKNPAMKTNKDAPSMFAIGRITAAFSRSLAEIGRKDVEIGCGTWHPEHLPAAHAFFEPGVKLYWLDWRTAIDQPEVQKLVRSIPKERPMLPVVWAHHDDRTYIGRPYKPYSNFVDLVEGTGTGFGIIHWTTRPLDLYFKSLTEQTWSDTRNRPLADTLRDMAGRSFGEKAADTGGTFLNKWVTEGRMFGRETSDRFIDVPLTDSAEVIARCRERIQLLNGIDDGKLAPEGRERLAFFRDYEKFTASFFESHAAYERASALHKAGDAAGARAAIAAADPRAVIEQYVKAVSHGSMTRGEQALVVSLNLRWLPYLVSLKQALGMEPARFKFSPTQHEPLAQGPGRNSFWIDSAGVLWKTLGEKETGVPAMLTSSADEMCASGIRLDRPLELNLGAAMGDGFAAGRYTAKAVSSPGQSLEVEVRPPADGKGGKLGVTLRPPAGGTVVCAIELSVDGARQ